MFRFSGCLKQYINSPPSHPHPHPSTSIQQPPRPAASSTPYLFHRRPGSQAISNLGRRRPEVGETLTRGGGIHSVGGGGGGGGGNSAAVDFRRRRRRRRCSSASAPSSVGRSSEPQWRPSYQCPADDRAGADEPERLQLYLNRNRITERILRSRQSLNGPPTSSEPPFVHSFSHSYR